MNQSTRAAVACYKCEYVACKACVRQYLMTLSAKPRCMNCAEPFGFSFLVKNLNRAWVNDVYRPVMQGVILSAEMALMPETAPFAEAEKERRALRKQNADYTQRIAKLTAQIRRYEYAIVANRYRMRGEEVPPRYVNDLTAGPAVTIDAKKRYVMACPSDGCKGFLNGGYRCLLCDQTTCADCLTLKAAGHVCDENQRLTAEAIKKDTRPCPTCGQRIFKIDGCDQMYCTNRADGVICGTAFSWRTGAIETGVIHNPHFYEVQRTQGVAVRNVGDVQCGGMPCVRGLLEVLGERYPPHRAFVRTCYQRLAEFMQYTVNDTRARLRRTAETRDLRVQYMLNDIPADRFSQTVFKQHKENQKLTDLYHLNELMSVTAIETFIDLVQYAQQPDLVAAMVTDRLRAMDAVRLYVNEQLKQVSINYNCSVKVFAPDYALVSKKYLISGVECR
jgi:hypothetical protein